MELRRYWSRLEKHIKNRVNEQNKKESMLQNKEDKMNHLRKEEQSRACSNDNTPVKTRKLCFFSVREPPWLEEGWTLWSEDGP